MMTAGFIPLSLIPWASQIVIVPNKNGVEIRLCIEYYKMVNNVTVIIGFYIPLVKITIQTGFLSIFLLLGCC